MNTIAADNLSILIVDDEKDLVELYESFLNGITVVQTATSAPRPCKQ